MKETIRTQARELGFDECRFTTAAPPESGPRLQAWLDLGCQADMAWLARNAAKRLHPQLVLPQVRSVVTVAAAYWASSVPPPAPGQLLGEVARYARHLDYHTLMGERLNRLAEFMTAQGGGKSLWYVDTGPVLERDLAQRAGVGFIGKHTNLVSRRLGNWFLLGEVLTTLELPPDPPEHNRCGRCTRCLDACPTEAFPSPFVLDARRCISYLTIEHKGSIPEALRPAIGRRIFGCDDCLAACPWNRFAREGHLMRSIGRPDLAAPDLLELLALSEADFKLRFAGTPMERTRRRGLRRNVCVALGNLGDASALPVLARVAREDEPLVAEHAAWACARLANRSGAGAVDPH